MRRHRSKISKHQLFFLSYLIENNLVKDFRIAKIKINGMSWDLAKGYMVYLGRIGYVTRKGKLWSVTEAGSEYYLDFKREYDRLQKSPLKWRE